MFSIVSDIERPPEALLDRFRAYSSPLVSDVLAKNQGTLRSDISPVFVDDVVVGPAVTVDAQPADNLIVHRALELAEPGDVIVIDADSYPESGIWGELMSMAAQQRELAGTIVDGGARDVEEIANLGYPVFSAHVSPKGSWKQLPGSINVPICCGDVLIDPGDIVVADANGVAVVPQGDGTAVADRCDEKLAAEERKRDATRIESSFSDAFDAVLGPYERADN